MNKPKIAILTIKNSYKYGGVLTCVRKLYKFCEKHFDPTVFVLSFDKDISTCYNHKYYEKKFRHYRNNGKNGQKHSRNSYEGFSFSDRGWRYQP